MAMSYLFLISLVVVVSSSGATNQPLLVKTKFGLVKGIFGHSETHKRKFSQFLGIPYALPPINDLRFQPPVASSQFYKPHKPLDATSFPGECPQLDMISGEYKGSEDCLFLNVFTPDVKFTEEPVYPVMVWLHGGSFATGSADPNFYGPERFLDEDVVLVTLNYRLGALGFLTTGDLSAPPNLGLLDQQLAMAWVKENIQAFGGDPGRITLFGESAGAVSVMAHMASPRATGLFHRAIAMSGVWGLQPALHRSRAPQHYASILATELGCDVTQTSEEIVTCLQGKPAKDIMHKAATFARYNHMPLVFTPVADSFMPSPLLPLPLSNPWDGGSESTGHYHDIPLIIGGNRDEGIISMMDFLTNEELFAAANADFAVEGPVLLLSADPDVAEREEAESATAVVLKQSYLGDNNFTKAAKQQIQNMFTDVHFLGPIDLTVQQLASAPGRQASTYYYNFQHRCSFSVPMAFGIMENMGVSHADELFLMFRNSDVSGSWLGDIAFQTEEDITTSKRLLDLWIQFARTGKPTQDNAWEAVGERPEDRRYAVLDSGKVRMEMPKEFKERMEVVQGMLQLINNHRNFNFSEHPALKQMEEERLKYVEEELQELRQQAVNNMDWGIKVETEGEDGSVEGETYDLQEEMRKLMQGEEDLKEEIEAMQADTASGGRDEL